MRLFIAIGLDETIKESLVSVQTELQKYQSNIRLVEMDNIHLTIRFLGEISEDRLTEIFQALSMVQDYTSFEFQLKNIGAFPSVKNPRVIWVGGEDKTFTLEKIYQAIETNLVKIGLTPDDHKFSTHITIGRNKFPEYNNDFQFLVDKYSDKTFGKQVIKQVTLFQSTLTPNGPIYKNIRDFKLKE